MKNEKSTSTGLLTQIDNKIKKLVKSKETLEKRVRDFESVSKVSVDDLEKLNFSEDLTKIKEIQRERLLEDISFILNDKIRELEQKEDIIKQKDEVLDKLTKTLNEKIFQLELANKTIIEQKKQTDKLNFELNETIRKLRQAEKELTIERDWLAEQVERKSLEVLSTIEQLIQSENKLK